jgi:hypothetical protein
MSRRDVLAALRRPFGGSALREPSSGEVYEGRLPQARVEPARREPVVGANLLDGRGAAPQAWLARSSSVAHVTTWAAGSSAMREWAPWCEQCQLPPMGSFSQGNAECLANKHDAVFHGGAWTAEALPAAEVARLAVGSSR